MFNKQKLIGKVIAITGGARGIGLATAETLIAQGAQVCIGDLDFELAEQQAKRIGAKAFALDVRNPESFKIFIEDTIQHFGGLYALVNNAGIMPMGAFLDESAVLTDTQIDINLRGVIYGMKLVLPILLQQKQGHIINVSSLAGYFALPGSAVYSATKYAVIGLTEGVAGEHRDSGVSFTAILPSKVLTELSSGTEEAGKLIPSVTPQQVADAILLTLLKPRLFIAVPDYLRLVHRSYIALPQWAQKGARRILKDQRILTQLDHQTRAGYEHRLNDLIGK